MKHVLKSLFAAALMMTSIAACDIDQTREGEMPEVDVHGGQLPEFDVETPEVELGTERETIEVPNVEVETRETEVEVPDVDVRMPNDDND